MIASFQKLQSSSRLPQQSPELKLEHVLSQQLFGRDFYLHPPAHIFLEVTRIQSTTRPFKADIGNFQVFALRNLATGDNASPHLRTVCDFLDAQSLIGAAG